MTGKLPDRVELRYVTAGTSGVAAMTESRIEKTREKIAATAAAIRAGEFTARPGEYACRRCACRPICRESAV